jgi:uncharacterized cupredoxin-like copper-binding protein
MSVPVLARKPTVKVARGGVEGYIPCTYTFVQGEGHREKQSQVAEGARARRAGVASRTYEHDCAVPSHRKAGMTGTRAVR